MPPAATARSSSTRKHHHDPTGNRSRTTAGRAKSGCFTCRIRRKKCDEEIIEELNSCQTCHRLGIECMGFGVKRPDWLRPKGVADAIRDLIKDHLGKQGKIKGHSGTGSRSQPQEAFLHLSGFRNPSLDNSGYHTGSSSSGREESVESERGTLFPDFSQYQHQHNQMYIQSEEMRSHSPVDQSLSLPQTFLPFGQDTYETPARRSNLSTLYHAHFTIDDPDTEYAYDPMNPSLSIINPSNILPGYLINDSMHEYVKNVIRIQYLLGDKILLPEMIWEAVGRHVPSQEAVSLLSQAYLSRQGNRNLSMLQDVTVRHRVSKLKDLLLAAEARFNADDAMAALHVVSLYLFDGGQGRWDEFLDLACSYTKRVLDDPQYFGSYPDALANASQKDEFVIKTTIWFDVLASITTLRPPRLLTYIRQLFQPSSWMPRTYSMLSPMGCDNTVVWALAETSTLSCWKATCEAQGNLSVRHLVNQVQEIEIHLRPGPRPVAPRSSPEEWSRYLTSEIFRTSTKLFLKSVESGDHPHVEEIRACVYETLNAILDMPPEEAGIDMLSASAVIRSTVFAFYICGSLTDSDQVLNILRNRLTQKPSDEGVGNTTTISDLLTILWDERCLQSPGHPVRWRRLLRKKEILLV